MCDALFAFPLSRLNLLNGKLRCPKAQDGLEYNYAYYPVVFESEKELLVAFDRLAKIDVFPRRYFYPSLNKLPYLTAQYASHVRRHYNAHRLPAAVCQVGGRERRKDLQGVKRIKFNVKVIEKTLD